MSESTLHVLIALALLWLSLGILIWRPRVWVVWVVFCVAVAIAAFAAPPPGARLIDGTNPIGREKWKMAPSQGPQSDIPPETAGTSEMQCWIMVTHIQCSRRTQKENTP